MTTRTTGATLEAQQSLVSSEPAVEPSHGSAPDRPWFRPRPLSLPGSTRAVVFARLSVTPSFVPRGWEGQVILVTACALTGYAVGAFLGWGWRVLQLPRLSRRVARGLWAAVAALVVVGLPAAAVVGRRWQLDQQQLLGMAPDVPWLWLAAPWLGLAPAAVLLVLCRGVR
jgi:uncharacterized membrane protein